MFLRGIFSKSSLNIMSTHTLEGLSSLNKLDVIPDVVLEYLYETAQVLDSKDYVAGVGNYVNIAVMMKKHEQSRILSKKYSRREYNFVASEGEAKDKMPKATIPEEVLSSNLDLVVKPNVSWSAKLRSATDEAIEFRYELEDMIEQFNVARMYLLETYAIDIKRMLYLIMQGRKATKEYLQVIFEREQDLDLLEVLVYLIKFIEFEEYLASEEEVLVLERW